MRARERALRARVGVGGQPRGLRAARGRGVGAERRAIEPSLPRSALPEPHTDTKVVDAVHIRLAQIEIVTKRCRHAFWA